MRRVPSLRDVAERAGVSPSTVSLVVNGKAQGRVSDRTQQAVRRAIDKLGYRVDPVARGLATGRRGTIAVIVPDLDSPFFNYVTTGIGLSLNGEIQMLLAFGQRGNRDLDATFDRILAMRVDGIVCEGISAEALRGRGGVHCPIVILDDPGTESTGPRVGFDLASAADQVAEHLALLGHRRVAYLTAEFDAPTFRVRRLGVQDRLRARVGRRASVIVCASETTTEAAEAAVTAHWRAWTHAGVTALICATDMQAYGALLALERLGVSVPQECSVVGFDNLPFSALTRPSLTSVSLPARKLGSEAAKILKRLIDTDPAQAASVTIPVELMIRESTGPARGSRDGHPRAPGAGTTSG